MAAPSIQSILDVADVRDDTIVLKDGSIRAVLAASSVNFELKSTEEQEAIILRYQSFLNALDFSIQTVIQSRDLDIAPYLTILRERQRQQESELLRVQTAEYVRFIKEFVDFAHIMQKRFYVVIPFTPADRKSEEGTKSGLLNSLKAAWNPGEASVELDEESFRTYRDQLFQRVSHVETTLSGAGIRTQRFNSDQLITLLHQSYNPGAVSSPGAATSSESQSS